eukprot:jgi/Galph1/419/GphlegSOOS_G5224.1
MSYPKRLCFECLSCWKLSRVCLKSHVILTCFTATKRQFIAPGSSHSLLFGKQDKLSTNGLSRTFVNKTVQFKRSCFNSRRLVCSYTSVSQSGGELATWTVIETPPVNDYLKRPVRVRFAPSPTGNLHVGGARTALFNWLHARKHKGVFVVRIEDTDFTRSTKENEENLLRDLRWLGLDWDLGPIPFEESTDRMNASAKKDSEFGPFRQSERGFVYKKYIEKLVQKGLVYPCFCSEEELEKQRLEAEQRGETSKYSGTCRQLQPEQVQKLIDSGHPYAYRFRVPKNTKVVLHDLVRGDVVWDVGATFGDFITMRSNGIPVYNFCVAIDDALMEISTVIRAEEHLTNTVRQALILNALDFPIPSYAHCSLILGGDRTKLSKRHGATSVNQFRLEGYLPEALLNYLALLGWHDGTENEFYTRDELVQAFDLCRLSKAPGIFDLDKLRWMNARYMKSIPHEEYVAIVHGRLLHSKLIEPDVAPSDPLIMLVSDLIRESVEVGSDCERLVSNIFSYPLGETTSSGEASELLAVEGGFYELAPIILRSYKDGTLPTGESENHMALWKQWIKQIGKETKRKGKHLFHPIRLALTGKMSGPDVGVILRILYLSEEKSCQFVPLSQRMRILEDHLSRK